MRPSTGRSPALCGLQHSPVTASLPGLLGSQSEGAEACCRSHPTHFCNQYRVLQRRALQAYTRNPLNVAGRTMMAIFIGILGGLVFMKDVSGESSCQDNSSGLYFKGLHWTRIQWQQEDLTLSGRTVSAHATDMMHGCRPQLLGHGVCVMARHALQALRASIRLSTPSSLSPSSWRWCPSPTCERLLLCVFNVLADIGWR